MPTTPGPPTTPVSCTGDSSSPRMTTANTVTTALLLATMGYTIATGAIASSWYITKSSSSTATPTPASSRMSLAVASAVPVRPTHQRQRHEDGEGTRADAGVGDPAAQLPRDHGAQERGDPPGQRGGQADQQRGLH